MKNRLEIIVIMILFLFLLFYFKKKKLVKKLPNPIENPIAQTAPNNQSTQPEIVPIEIPQLYEKSEKTCTDNYSNCVKWAAAGDCEINPEYMLFACPGACKACNLSPEEKQEIIIRASKLPLPGCTYHGESYPGYILPDYKNM